MASVGAFIDVSTIAFRILSLISAGAGTVVSTDVVGTGLDDIYTGVNSSGAFIDVFANSLRVSLVSLRTETRI